MHLQHYLNAVIWGICFQCQQQLHSVPGFEHPQHMLHTSHSTSHSLDSLPCEQKDLIKCRGCSALCWNSGERRQV